MRQLVVLLILILGVSVSCTAAGNGEEENASDEVTAITFITPASSDTYPGPGGQSAYPVPPDLSMLPTSYPESTVVAPSGELNPSELTPFTPDPLSPQVPDRPDVDSSPQLALLVEAVTADLRQYLGAPDEPVTVLSVMPIVWSNSALGCPAEGMAYAEVQVEGVLLTLEMAGEVYTYHAGDMKDYVLCQDGQPVTSGTVIGR